ncbi:MAG TPA: plastocyanin/azurin family copper-binding protein [Gemmatimonadaceae bacterium]|nr:plastocyanin/azurin family copper-binding protein [Gemmatimonadaceae bacterium]
MRFYALTAASILILGACAGGDNAGSTTDTAAPAATTTPPPGGGAQATTGAPITGTTHEVRMLLDGQTYKFDPADLTIKQGDGVRWIMVSGGPHNVAFDPAKVPDDVESVISANMPNQMMPLSSPYLTQPNENYTISFAGVKPGTYDYVCTPHVMMGMTGKITVQ